MEAQNGGIIAVLRPSQQQEEQRNFCTSSLFVRWWELVSIGSYLMTHQKRPFDEGSDGRHGYRLLETARGMKLEEISLIFEYVAGIIIVPRHHLRHYAKRGGQ
jgi:hypothetical protein